MSGCCCGLHFQCVLRKLCLWLTAHLQRQCGLQAGQCRQQPRLRPRPSYLLVQYSLHRQLPVFRSKPSSAKRPARTASAGPPWAACGFPGPGVRLFRAPLLLSAQRLACLPLARPPLMPTRPPLTHHSSSLRTPRGVLFVSLAMPQQGWAAATGSTRPPPAARRCCRDSTRRRLRLAHTVSAQRASASARLPSRPRRSQRPVRPQCLLRVSRTARSRSTRRATRHHLRTGLFPTPPTSGRALPSCCCSGSAGARAC